MKASGRITLGLILLLLAGLLLTVGANSWKSGLVVRKILVEGNRVVDANEILQLAHVQPGMKLYDLDLMVIRRDVLSHYFLNSVLVERDLPSTIRITVVERTPLAMVNRDGILYLDQDGVVLPHQVSRELFDLPIVTGIPNTTRLAMGTTLKHPDIREALVILSTAKAVSRELYHLISEVCLREGGDIILYTAEEGIPVLFGRGHVSSKLVRLDTFWNSVVRERGIQDLEYIDLRYENQVVVRWKPSHRKVASRS
ncbi:MAG: FtsQ-type POTRA domain-containing protein [Ignavibacteriales bacterium]|nr:FtsQ-type POTRA domain-containing protein [Ignavibacteriales bacterium]